MNHPLTWKKFHPLSDQNAFICLVDHMGDDSSIVQAARVSYGKDKTEPDKKDCWSCKGTGKMEYFKGEPSQGVEVSRCDVCNGKGKVNEPYSIQNKDRNLIRYLMNHSHTTPFEMVEIKFMVQVPMDCWRQWIRHRTASVNEYSTRYTEALDFFQVTSPSEWRLQATDNKQGSSGFLPEDKYPDPNNAGPYKTKLLDGGHELSIQEHQFHAHAKRVYKNRLNAGVAKEQARKDLPLSTYTRAYWKCDLHNIFNFLRLRMDSHAQLEIRQFANCMFEIVKQLCPVACEAFEDYVLGAKKFSRMEMELLSGIMNGHGTPLGLYDKPNSLSTREWNEFKAKLNV